MSSFPPNSTIVLVHGAWADGSCWKEVILPLQRRGPQGQLRSDSAYFVDRRRFCVDSFTRADNGPDRFSWPCLRRRVIGAVREERVKSLVYIAALAPDEGETVAKVFYREKPHPNAPKLIPDKHGFLWMPEEGFCRAVAHRASPEQTSIMAAVQRPISVHCIEEAAPAPGWKARPSWFLLAEEDRMINPKTQQFMAHRMGANVRSSRIL